MDRSLSDRVALVTGSYRGTGRGIAHVLAREGARVVVADRDLVSAQDTVNMIAGEGGEASAAKVDALNP